MIVITTARGAGNEFRDGLGPLLARLRDRLAEAAALCREGRTQEAETPLRELQGQWMPKDPGN